MSKLKEERLNQMIENALSYKQELKILNQNSFFRRLKVFIFKPKVYGFTFASFVISYVFIPQILISRNFVDVDEINDFVTYEIIKDLYSKFYK